jgi:uncharacterized repeat protein (TIGR03803 family)
MKKKLSIASILAVIFALTLSILTMSSRSIAQTETVLYSFGKNARDADQPRAGVIFDSAGNLYGTTFEGGREGFGAIYELSPVIGGGWSEAVLFSFGDRDGYAEAWGPQASLLFDGAGSLYGTRGAYGDGMVFELTLNGSGGWTETPIFRFDGKNGDYPESALIMDSAGNLYGTTNSGGAGGYGVVFELIKGASRWTEKVLHSFMPNKHDGLNPNSGSLVMDSAGNIFGTTESGGNNVSRVCQSGCGTVFELSPTGDGRWTEKLLQSFDDNGTDGIFPQAGVIFDRAGNLYGTTTEGGAGSCKADNELVGCGTLFKLSPAGDGSWSEAILHGFQGTDTDGQWPQGGAGLVMDGAGNIYGTTGLGGAYNSGTVFEFSPVQSGGWTESILHNFEDNGIDGSGPDTNLVFDSAGNLYGTTASGGSLGDGVVYEVTP